jgi:integrase
MSIKLAPPRPAKTPYYSGRGTYFGIYVDRSTKDRQRPLAIKVIRQWEREIEDGNFVGPDNPTFASASLSYMRSGGERKFLTPLLKYFGETPLKQITQALIDRAAAELLPNGTAPTRNRQIYTPVSAVLHHAGSTMRVRRQKGWRGNRATSWLEPEQAFALFTVADEVDREFGLLVKVLTYTGMRISEALSVRLRDLHLDQGAIYLPKTKKVTRAPCISQPSS